MSKGNPAIRPSSGKRTFQIALDLPKIFLWPSKVLEGHRELIGYIYLLRFSILLWLALILLPILDWAGLSTSVTHVMFALEGFGQFVAVGFYVVLTGWIALLSARVVCAYGEERFGVAPPRAFAVGHDMSWRTFLVSQVPGCFFLLYAAAVSAREAGSNSSLFWFQSHPLFWKVLTNAGQLLAGGAFAFYVWYMVAFFYCLLRTPPADAGPDVSAPGEKRSADAKFHALLLPRDSWLLLDIALRDQVESRWVEWISERFADLAEILGPGYQREGNLADLHAGHALSIILLLLFAAVYVSVGLLTSPHANLRLLTALMVTLFAVLTVSAVSPKWGWARRRLPRIAFKAASLFVTGWLGWVLASRLYSFWTLIFSFLAFAGVLVIWVVGEGQEKADNYYRALRLAAIAVALLFFASLSSSVFPVLASILILLQSLYWLGAGFAFWADRFRSRFSPCWPASYCCLARCFRITSTLPSPTQRP
jgi:hypothetical protein